MENSAEARSDKCSKIAKFVPVVRTKEISEQRMNLPIYSEESIIMDSLLTHHVIIICGETGSGKTTQVPQFLWEAGYGHPNSEFPGMIGVTQPRRIAATSVCERVATELNEIGTGTVGYQIRYESHLLSEKTKLKFMTDGILLREIESDSLLKKYSAIILDEAHERTINTDILIGLLSRIVVSRARNARLSSSKNSFSKLSPLKLIIMSATLQVEQFTQNRRLFPFEIPIIRIPGRQYPITIHFSRVTPPHTEYINSVINKVGQIHTKLPPGNVLVFLTGKEEVDNSVGILREKYGWKKKSVLIGEKKNYSEDDSINRQKVGKDTEISGIDEKSSDNKKNDEDDGEENEEEEEVDKHEKEEHMQFSFFEGEDDVEEMMETGSVSSNEEKPTEQKKASFKQIDNKGKLLGKNKDMQHGKAEDERDETDKETSQGMSIEFDEENTMKRKRGGKREREKQMRRAKMEEKRLKEKNRKGFFSEDDSSDSSDGNHFEREKVKHENQKNQEKAKKEIKNEKQKKKLEKHVSDSSDEDDKEEDEDKEEEDEEENEHSENASEEDEEEEEKDDEEEEKDDEEEDEDEDSDLLEDSEEDFFGNFLRGKTEKKRKIEEESESEGKDEKSLDTSEEENDDDEEEEEEEEEDNESESESQNDDDIAKNTRKNRKSMKKAENPTNEDISDSDDENSTSGDSNESSEPEEGRRKKEDKEEEEEEESEDDEDGNRDDEEEEQSSAQSESGSESESESAFEDDEEDECYVVYPSNWKGAEQSQNSSSAASKDKKEDEFLPGYHRIKNPGVSIDESDQLLATSAVLPPSLAPASSAAGNASDNPSSASSFESSSSSSTKKVKRKREHTQIPMYVLPLYSLQPIKQQKLVFSPPPFIHELEKEQKQRKKKERIERREKLLKAKRLLWKKKSKKMSQTQKEEQEKKDEEEVDEVMAQEEEEEEEKEKEEARRAEERGYSTLYRLVVVATNVAETSLTIPGIRYVVDCGKVKKKMYCTAEEEEMRRAEEEEKEKEKKEKEKKEKEKKEREKKPSVNISSDKDTSEAFKPDSSSSSSLYQSESGIVRFNVLWTSRASADQRGGRSGRVGPGHVYRLFSSAVFLSQFFAFDTPEIVRTPLDGVVLSLLRMKITNVTLFPFPTAVPLEVVRGAVERLMHIQAVRWDERRKMQLMLREKEMKEMKEGRFSDYAITSWSLLNGTKDGSKVQSEKEKEKRKRTKEGALDEDGEIADETNFIMTASEIEDEMKKQKEARIQLASSSSSATSSGLTSTSSSVIAASAEYDEESDDAGDVYAEENTKNSAAHKSTSEEDEEDDEDSWWKKGMIFSKMPKGKQNGTSSSSSNSYSDKITQKDANDKKGRNKSDKSRNASDEPNTLLMSEEEAKAERKRKRQEKERMLMMEHLQITPIGEMVAVLPLAPRFGKMIVTLVIPLVQKEREREKLLRKYRRLSQRKVGSLMSSSSADGAETGLIRKTIMEKYAEICRLIRLVAYSIAFVAATSVRELFLSPLEIGSSSYFKRLRAQKMKEQKKVDWREKPEKSKKTASSGGITPHEVFAAIRQTWVQFSFQSDYLAMMAAVCAFSHEFVGRNGEIKKGDNFKERTGGQNEHEEKEDDDQKQNEAKPKRQMNYMKKMDNWCMENGIRLKSMLEAQKMRQQLSMIVARTITQQIQQVEKKGDSTSGTEDVIFFDDGNGKGKNGLSSLEGQQNIPIGDNVIENELSETEQRGKDISTSKAIISHEPPYLSPLLFTQLLHSFVDPHLPPPSRAESILLKQSIASGLIDHVGFLVDVEVPVVSNEQSSAGAVTMRRRKMYKASGIWTMESGLSSSASAEAKRAAVLSRFCLIEQGSFALSAEGDVQSSHLLPRCVVFGDVLKTSSEQLSLRGVTEISPAWLLHLASSSLLSPSTIIIPQSTLQHTLNTPTFLTESSFHRSLSTSIQPSSSDISKRTALFRSLTSFTYSPLLDDVVAIVTASYQPLLQPLPPTLLPLTHTTATRSSSALSFLFFLCAGFVFPRAWEKLSEEARQSLWNAAECFLEMLQKECGENEQSSKAVGVHSSSSWQCLKMLRRFLSPPLWANQNFSHTKHSLSDIWKREKYMNLPVEHSFLWKEFLLLVPQRCQKEIHSIWPFSESDTISTQKHKHLEIMQKQKIKKNKANTQHDMKNHSTQSSENETNNILDDILGL
ncbi:putative DEAD/DEAH box helicase [Monocercomonoides exilis]|uniref:putative DEAD/DEAH box helicase n=1 Tax=Monocercomonoides exilis TaxID=2049356 RepID=UPI00355A415F|nr:putative DEAD/DEAH box helicase [Monocercomonoides exilis]